MAVAGCVVKIEQHVEVILRVEPTNDPSARAFHAIGVALTYWGRLLNAVETAPSTAPMELKSSGPGQKNNRRLALVDATDGPR
jgi:hypothetical protein